MHNNGQMKRAAVALAATFAAIGLMASLSGSLRAQQPPAEATETYQSMIGKPAPAFTLPDQNNQSVALASQKGKWVVLAFYPADMTSGCTLQNRSYTAQSDKFAPLNAVVYTISTQGTESKQQFCSKEGLKHSLLSDVGGKVATAYGIAVDNPRYGKVAKRVTFYLSPDGTIVAVDPKIRVATAAEDSLAMLTKLQQNTTQETKTVVTRRFGGPADTKVALGEEVADFGLPDATTGRTKAFSTLRAGKKAAVVVFIGTQCPVSNAYNERLTKAAAKYASKGVQFIGINSDRDEPIAEVAAHAKKNSFGFPVLKDAGNKIADRFEARVTPEVYVTDANGVLVYHGPVDNSQNLEGVSERYLEAALDSVLAGKPVATNFKRPFGCTIKRVASDK
ncbi:MAG: hypothetical protein OHK0029_21390 [Armatimonadaceae bacterium]